ncbi:MAG: S-methyl-5'-thioadenosine phosphorylase [Candidatus Nanoarchaeia archaeon]|nr:S-methyl-5'-thioadenosine phosphorylase [Candidatus Nanoarchaeia archaeon]
MTKIGIIGGSGLDNPNILEDKFEYEVETPYGKPSDRIVEGKIKGVEVAILARHGRKHNIPPSQVNYRANVYALKQIGCDLIIATTAVGSLREEIGRGDFVILDQFIDFTRHRKVSFFEHFDDKPVHVSTAEPFDKNLREVLIETAKELKLKVHEKGTVITIEGPRFSTKAESKMFRMWGADVINMSIAPEAILANELGIRYSAVAMSTDYDCWKEGEESVSWEMVYKIFEQNAEKMKSLLINIIPKLAKKEIDLKSKVRTIPDFPKKGIMFRDITTLLNDKYAFSYVLEKLYERYRDSKIDVIAGIESRGFIIGGALANLLGVGFVPIRKPGKLPFNVDSVEYSLEYGTDKLEIHVDSIKENQNVLLIDDLLATGGTAKAAADLIERRNAKVFEIAFVIELPDLKGRDKLRKYDIYSMISFEGE